MKSTGQIAVPQQPHRIGLLWMFVLSWGVALLLVAFGTGDRLLNFGEHALGIGFEVAAAVLGLWLALILIWWNRQRGKLDLFELPVWFSVNVYVQIVLNGWLFQRDLSFRSPWLAYNAGTMAMQAVLLMGVGLTAMWIGYVWAHRVLERRSKITKPIAGSPQLDVIVIIWVITWLISSISVVSGVSGYLSARSFIGQNYLFFANLLGNLATFALMLYHFQRPTQTGWVWLIFACGSEVLLGLIVGTKGAVLILLYAIMTWYYARGKLSKRWLLAGMVFLLLIVPTVNQFRENLFRAGFDRSAGASLAERVPILIESVEQVITQPPSRLIEETRGTFETRQGSILEITAAFMAVHPSVRPYVALDMGLLIAQQVIPRFLWPGKPTARPALYMIYTAYLGHPEETTFAGPGQFADAYRTGGWLFVVLWFLGLGAFSAWLYQLGPGSGNLAGTAFYLTLLTGILTYDSSVFEVVIRLLQFGVLYWIITKYFMFKPLHRGESITHPSLRERVVQ